MCCVHCTCTSKFVCTFMNENILKKKQTYLRIHKWYLCIQLVKYLNANFKKPKIKKKFKSFLRILRKTAAFVTIAI